MGAQKRAAEEVVQEVNDVEALAAKKAAKKAKKAAAAAAVAEPIALEEDADAVALAEKKAAKKAKKAAAAAAAAAAEQEPEEDAEATALAAKKAAKKAKKAAAAAAAAAEEEEVSAPKAKKEEKSVPAPKAEAAKATPAEDEEWKDNTYKCCDCNEDWIDTAGDQEFRYDKGFAETPKRCKDCRWAKKVRMEGGDPTAKGKGKGKSKEGGKGNDENTVFVRGLPFAATEETLTKDFTECGEIVTLRMPMNDEGTPRGFAFIKYADKAGMDKAMAFNETDYGGRTIYCSDAAIKPEGKGKGKDGKDGKGKDKGKGKKGKKGKAPSESFAKSTGAMVESTGTKVAFADSDDE